MKLSGFRRYEILRELIAGCLDVLAPIPAALDFDLDTPDIFGSHHPFEYRSSAGGWSREGINATQNVCIALHRVKQANQANGSRREALQHS